MSTNYKGIVLAGGTGSRLLPMTLGVSKQLLPVYDKPMIYYPLSILMLAGVKEILIITTPEDLVNFRKLLGDGKRFGCSFCYAVQETPKGIADAFLIGADFIGQNPVVLILGDNLFYGQGLANLLAMATSRSSGATIFGYPVKDPERFGVVELDKLHRVLSIEEKPTSPRSKLAITGLYFYDNQIVDIASSIQPSGRGELEISDINKEYLEKDRLHVQVLGRGFVWLDAGTPNSLMEAGQLVQSVESRQGFKIACLEEIACRNGWIEVEALKEAAQSMVGSLYGEYLLSIAEEMVSFSG